MNKLEPDILLHIVPIDFVVQANLALFVKSEGAALPDLKRVEDCFAERSYLSRKLLVVHHILAIMFYHFTTLLGYIGEMDEYTK